MRTIVQINVNLKDEARNRSRHIPNPQHKIIAEKRIELHY